MPSAGRVALRPMRRHQRRNSLSQRVSPSYQSCRWARAWPLSSSSQMAVYGRWYSATLSDGISSSSCTDPACAVPVAKIIRQRKRFSIIRTSGYESEQQQPRQDQDGASDRPGGRAMTAVQPQQHQAGEGKHQAGDGKDVDKPEPHHAAVAALVQVVEQGDQAPVGILELDLAGLAINRDPAVAAGTWQRQVQ